LKAGSYRFTAEGVPAAPCSFIAGGRLVQPILNVKYAGRLGMPPTPVPFAMDTLHLEGAATLTSEEAFRKAAGGAMVLSVLGVHTQDASSGDFSLSAPQTLRLGARGPLGRLKATISGNLFRMLRSEELHLVRFEGEHTPGLLIRCRMDPN
jgi:PmbA protein